MGRGIVRELGLTVYLCALFKMDNEQGPAGQLRLLLVPHASFWMGREFGEE